MRAVLIPRFGNPDVLEIRDIPTPEPRAGEVLVAVRACGVNRADVLQRRGLYPPPDETAAPVPGLEFAGEIVACGAGTDRACVGQRVMGILPGGGYAEFVRTPARLCLPVPERLDWPRAAALPEALATAYDALCLQAGLVAGERVLVHAAASGVGTTALAMARAMGANPIALSRSADKRARLAALFGCPVFDPADDALAATAAVNVVLDLVGGAAVPINEAVLAEGGRWVVIGLLGGSRAQVDLLTWMRKGLRVSASMLRSRSLDEKARLTSLLVRDALPWVDGGTIEPVLDEVLPLEDAPRAHARMERNDTFGKIVLTVSGRAS